MAETIRVLIAEDHTFLRAGARLLLQAEPDIDVLGEAGDGETAIAQTEALRPDVVLMDLTMPGISGLEATHEIKRRWPQVHVLAQIVHRSDDHLFRMLEAGASGYILKRADPVDLLTAVRAAQRGYVVLCASMAKRLVSGYSRRVWVGETGKLR